MFLIPRGAWNETFLFKPEPGTSGSMPGIYFQNLKVNFNSFLSNLGIFLTSPGSEFQVC